MRRNCNCTATAAPNDQTQKRFGFEHLADEERKKHVIKVVDEHRISNSHEPTITNNAAGWAFSKPRMPCLRCQWDGHVCLTNY